MKATRTMTPEQEAEWEQKLKAETLFQTAHPRHGYGVNQHCPDELCRAYVRGYIHGYKTGLKRVNKLEEAK